MEIEYYISLTSSNSLYFILPYFISSFQVLTELKKVNFSQNGYHVSFDAFAFYELVNWQKTESGVIELVTVGYYDASLPMGQEFRINRNLSWMEGGTRVMILIITV